MIRAWDPLSTQAPFEAILMQAGPEELVAEPYDRYVIMFILTIVYCLLYLLLRLLSC